MGWVDRGAGLEETGRPGGRLTAPGGVRPGEALAHARSFPWRVGVGKGVVVVVVVVVVVLGVVNECAGMHAFSVVGGTL